MAYYTNEEIIKQFKEVHGDKYIYDRVEYKGSHEKIWIGCRVEGHGYFKQSPNSHKQGQGCPNCAGNILTNDNLMANKRPNLIKYLRYEEDAYLYSHMSNKKIRVVCPICKSVKSMKVNNLSKRGFSCQSCSDGISTPEKFGIYLFKQLNVEFETQKIFDWTNKRYDKYFVLNGEEFIVEIHGEQHYTHTGFKRSLEEEQENDKIKYNLAIENGIKSKNYIVIDCRCSEFDWLKENYIKSLSNYFNLSNINWDKIWENSQNSLSVKVWCYWKNKSECETTYTISKLFGVDRSTIVRYLKNGQKLGMCKYDPKEEMSKYGRKHTVEVYQYTKEGVFLKMFYSIINAEKETGVYNPNIIRCCKGTLKTAGGFKWSYNPPINGMYPNTKSKSKIRKG